MNTLAVVLLCVVSPLAALAAPFLFQLAPVRRIRDLYKYLPIRRPRFLAPAPRISARKATSTGRLRLLIEGVLLSGCVIAALLSAADEVRRGSAALTTYPGSVLMGVAAGIALIAGIHLVSATIQSHRMAARFSALGITGFWRDSAATSILSRSSQAFLWRIEQALAKWRLPGAAVAEEPPGTGFRETLIAAVAAAGSFDALSCDGLDLLKTLARNPDDLAQGPHPAVKEARLRLLVLPPRSRHVDPGCQRLTCAEAALGRIGRSAEEQWRLLKHALAVRNLWAEQFGVKFDLRFIESRPAFACLLAGPRGWMHTWPNLGGSWIELEQGGDKGSLYPAVEGLFLGEWAAASDELEVPLGNRPGSTVIRKEAQGHSHGNLRVVEVR
ncbi:MAG: hypothetical protein L0Z55_13235 [Planctomycetes bacterium]|nr:hypothetical protein [Planctomycetota bacterium]